MAVELFALFFNNKNDASHGFITSIVSSFFEFSVEFLSFWYKVLYGRIIDHVVLKNELLSGMDNATSYSEWLYYASALDKHEGHDIWRLQDRSSDYDHDLIARRIEEMQSAYTWKDVNAVAFLLRTSMSRNIGNISSKKLFQYSRIGTKNLIENYLNQVSQLIDYVLTNDIFFENITLSHIGGTFKHGISHIQPIEDIKEYKNPHKLILKKLSFFSDLRHALGNSALMLSGGATLGIHHIGVIKSLYEQKMLPRILSGSSAGSIVAAMVAVRLDSEIQEVLSSLKGVSWHFFEEPQHADGFHSWSVLPFTRVARQLIRLLRDGAVFDNDVLTMFLQEHVGANITFLEAYNRTRRVLNVAVSSTTAYEMPRLLNYLTSPDVLIWSAVAASCAAPTLFRSSRILIKTATGKITPWSPADDSTWMDGSVENDLPISRISTLFNVNPHVVPFLTNSGTVHSVFQMMKRPILHVLREEILFRIPILIEFSLLPRKFGIFLRNILSQQYEGDVTIVPNTIALTDLFNLFSAPSIERVHSSVLRGERATWPSISYIRSQTFIEMKLDKVLYDLKCKLLDDATGKSELKTLRTPTPEQEPILWTEVAAVPPLLSELEWRASPIPRNHY